MVLGLVGLLIFLWGILYMGLREVPSDWRGVGTKVFRFKSYYTFLLTFSMWGYKRLIGQGDIFKVMIDEFSSHF